MEYLGFGWLVPPIELCGQIPEGQFKNSALVWVKYQKSEPLVMPRAMAKHLDEEVLPAPTLQEIFVELPSPSRVGVVSWEAYWPERAINEWFFYRRERI